MIIEFSQLNQDALFDLEKHLNSSSVFDTFYQLDSFNLEVTKAH